MQKVLEYCRNKNVRKADVLVRYGTSKSVEKVPQRLLFQCIYNGLDTEYEVKKASEYEVIVKIGRKKFPLKEEKFGDKKYLEKALNIGNADGIKAVSWLRRNGVEAKLQHLEYKG
jgi:hypothetical protein